MGGHVLVRIDVPNAPRADGAHQACVDLLVTDPPYMTDLEDVAAFAADWIPLAINKLKDTGRAYIFTGAYWLEIDAYFHALRPMCEQRSFAIDDPLAWVYRNTLGPAPSDTYKRNWQTIWHLRGPHAPPLECPLLVEQFSVQDMNAPDGRHGDRRHTWQKPDEFGERFIRHATQPGDLVVDPFAGTGTFLLAAARLGRRAVGAERDPKMLALALQRGCVEGDDLAHHQAVAELTNIITPGRDAS